VKPTLTVLGPEGSRVRIVTRPRFTREQVKWYPDVGTLVHVLPPRKRSADGRREFFGIVARLLAFGDTRWLVRPGADRLSPLTARVDARGAVVTFETVLDTVETYFVTIGCLPLNPPPKKGKP
jgi:hypothetical protein